MIIKLFLSCCLTVMMISNVWADTASQNVSIETVLKSMMTAESSDNYVAVINWSNGSKSQSIRVARGSLNGERAEKIEYLEGVKRGVLKVGPVGLCEQGESIKGPDFWHRILTNIKSNVGYDATLIGADRVAGREAWRIQIAAVDGYRYAHILSVDKRSGVILKSLLVDDSGQVLERMQFVSLQLNAATPADFIADQSDQVVYPVSSHCKVPSASNWIVQNLPNGFVFQGGQFDSENAREWLRFSDGISAFSVFIEPDAKLRGIRRDGSIIIVSQPASIAGKQYTITVVGDIPPRTVDRIISSIAYRGNSK